MLKVTTSNLPYQKIKTDNASEKKQYTLHQPNSYPISNLAKTSSLNQSTHSKNGKEKRKHLLKLVFVSREVGSQFFDINLFAFHLSSSKFYSDYFSSEAESNQSPILLSKFYLFIIGTVIVYRR